MYSFERLVLVAQDSTSYVWRLLMISVKQTIFSRAFWGCLLVIIFFFIVNLFHACTSNAKTELMQKDIPYSIDSFLQQAAKGDKETVQLFIKAGMDVNSGDDRGHTALIAASITGRTEMVRFLIEKGADVNAKENNGVTALMIASGKGWTELVKLLLEKGVDVNAKENNGATALIIASSTGKSDIASLLRNAGAKE